MLDAASVWPRPIGQEQGGMQGGVTGNLKAIVSQHAHRKPLGQGSIQPGGGEGQELSLLVKVAGPGGLQERLRPG